jgi:Arc/MetJ family transcription regulator
VGESVVATKLAIDGELLCEAVRIGGQRTKKATVNEALREYVQRRKRLKAVNLFGTIEFDSRYDRKAARKKR